jgi:hypothetical protein
VSLTDEEIDRTLAGVTPTATAVTAPAVLDEMRAAIRRERNIHLAHQVGRALDVGGTVAGYLGLVLAIVALVVR